jgi:hypothetical protein
MRHAWVVYESMFGNTREVAEAIGRGLSQQVDTVLFEVGAAPRQIPPTVDLVVVGGPTHAFSMSRESTRRSAADQGADQEAAGHGGIREWIGEVTVHDGLHSAAFDTKVAKPHLPGSAARAAARKMHRRGFDRIADPETFFVADTAGGLLEGEVDRAQEWGAHLVAS